jgi:hypothetical protein
VDPVAARRLADTYATIAAALDTVLAALPGEAAPTSARLWPEHFDVALDCAARPGVRVNLGGSPGDRFCAVPYLYVGPWTDDRPGQPAFWNAPFGAFVTLASLADRVGDESTAKRAANFLLDGLRRFA